MLKLYKLGLSLLVTVLSTPSATHAQENDRPFFVTSFDGQAAQLITATQAFEKAGGEVEQMHLFYPSRNFSGLANYVVFRSSGVEYDLYLHVADNLRVGPTMRFQVSENRYNRDILLELSPRAKLEQIREQGTACTIEDVIWLTVVANTDGRIQNLTITREQGCNPTSFTVPVVEQDGRMSADLSHIVEVMKDSDAEMRKN